jgi:hypothetical protein
MQTVQLIENEGKWEITTSTEFVESDYDFLKNTGNEALFDLLKNSGLVASSAKCSTCNDVLTLISYDGDRHPYFICRKRSCVRNKIKALKNSILTVQKLAIKSA